MRIIWYLIFVVIMLLACKNQENNTAPSTHSLVEFNADSLPLRNPISSNAQIIVDGWPEFAELETSFDALYGAENREDLIFVIEDLIEKQKLLEESTYPIEFDKPQIKSRQKVLKTYILKTKGALEYRTDIKGPTSEMIEAFNHMRNQFNVVMNNTIDTKSLFDE